MSEEPSARSRAPGRVPLAGPVAWAVAWRFLSHRRSRLLDGTARAALAATALGVTAMVIAMALMTGYRQDLEAKVLSGNAAVLAYPLGGGDDAPRLDRSTLERLAALPGVARIGQVAYGQGALSPRDATGDGEARTVEVTLRGVGPGGGSLSARTEQLAPDADGVPGVVLGDELARSLAVAEGDVLRLVALGFEDGRPRFRYAALRVAGTFSSGFAEFDGGWAVIGREEVHRLVGAGATDVVEIGAVDNDDAGAIALAAGEVLGTDWLVTDARRLNRELFTALELQQTILFLLLGLIVAVATFNTASTLVVLVRERMRDVGVLATLGVSPTGLGRIFLLYGGLLGVVGTLLGVVVGVGASWILTEFQLIRFSPEVAAIYFLSSVSFRVEASDLAAIVTFTLGITLLACLVPAWIAARVDPAAALRYE